MPSRRHQAQSASHQLVVLSDVTEGLLEDIVVADLELDVEGLPQSLADLLVAADRGLPPLEADPTDDLVDPIDDVLDDDRGLIALKSVEQLRQGRFALFFAGYLVYCLLGRDGVSGELEELA